MILNGDLKAVSEITGHRDVNLTIKQYEHITTEIKAQTINAIEELDIQMKQTVRGTKYHPVPQENSGTALSGRSAVW